MHNLIRISGTVPNSEKSHDPILRVLPATARGLTSTIAVD